MILRNKQTGKIFLEMRYLNLGCGSKFHPDWINVDMYPANDLVIGYNFLRKIPFNDGYFDVVYHSHVIEHFSPKDGQKLISECFRVLKPGGIIRIVFPDLEKIAREYLRHLERVEKNDVSADDDYNWILLELFDQMVRNESGGEMIKYMKNPMIRNKQYVVHRIGDYQNIQNNAPTHCKPNPELRDIKKRLKNRGSIIKKFFKKAIAAKDKVLITFLSNEKKSFFKIGTFRKNGEIHQCMYDRYSIKKLLQQCGFKKIVIRTAEESYIKYWATFCLDDPNENVSLFVEAIKL